ncbi:MAG: maleylpyruvate isomerase N-terminal domain-containing protein [Acidimicrobiales bacterium]
MTDLAQAGKAGPPAGHLAACRASHERIYARLEAIDDVVVKRPSRLPGWTIGHVLTHLARNADSFVRILEAAAENQQVAQYAGGAAQRTGEIDTGATRSAAAIVNDVRSASGRLDAAFSDAGSAAWSASWTTMGGVSIVCEQLPARRMREVEFHHVDLGLGYEPIDWPAEFVALSLVDALAALPDRMEDPSQRASFLAWVAGRRDSPGTLDLAPF